MWKGDNATVYVMLYLVSTITTALLIKLLVQVEVLTDQVITVNYK